MRKILSVGFVLILISSVWAVPRLIPYQGKLTDTAGVGINGTRDIQLSIFPAPTGGGAIWTETHWNTAVTNGLFDVVMGSVTPLNLDFSAGPYYLQVSVNTDALIPRQQLLAEVYAIRAIYADSVEIPDNVMVEGDSISLLFNDAGFITTVNWDTLDFYSLIGHTHDFTDLTGNATDAQIPNDITIDFAALAGAVEWADILNIPPDIDDGDDFDTLIAHWGNVRNIPPGFADNIDNVDTMIAHWSSLRNIPADIDDGDDIDTFIAHWDSIRNIPPDFADGNDASGDNDWAYSSGSDLTGEIHHDGNVGIMVADPAWPLHVAGTPGGYAIFSEGNMLINSGLDFGEGFGDSNEVLMADGHGNCDWTTLPSTGNIGDLLDVDVSGVLDGQVLKWIAAAHEWRPSNDISGTGSTGDNWGTQFVTRNSSLIGDGTPSDTLGIDWNSVLAYVQGNVDLGDLFNVNTAGVADAHVLTWVAAANQWRPVAIGPGGLGDNWGTQIVIHNNSLIGDGTPGAQLRVNWDTLGAYFDTTIALNDLADVTIDTLAEYFVLSWDDDDNQWKPRLDNDDDPYNELLDYMLWEPLDEEDDTLFNTLRIVEHGDQWDVVIEVTKDDLSDNSISNLSDVDTMGVEYCNLLHWDSTNWVPYSQIEMFDNHIINDLGDVDITEPLEPGDFLVWTADSVWEAVVSIFDIVNLWQDVGGNMEPLDIYNEYVDFKIFEKDTTWALYLYDTNYGSSGEWYGMYLSRYGAAASDGYGIRSIAGTSGGVAPGSEFYGVKGEAHGGSMVYGIYGYGDDPGAGGVGYGVYGRGHDAGGFFYGPDNDGEVASLKLQSGSQYMLLDGNEIDAIDDILMLQNNSGMGTAIRKGGFSLGSDSSDDDALLQTFSIQLATDSLLNSAYHSHTGALIYTTLNGTWGTGKLRTRIADNWRSYYEEDAMWVGYNESYVRGNLGVGTEDPDGKLHVSSGNAGTLDQSFFANGTMAASGPGGARWQSFTAGVSGYMVRFSIYFFDDRCEITFRIYSGNGTGGTLLTEFVVPASDITGQHWEDFYVPSPPYLSNGSQYTIQIYNSATSGTFGWMGGGDSYPGGQSEGTGDHSFRTYMSSVTTADFLVDGEGNVGIGTANPDARLEINALGNWSWTEGNTNPLEIWNGNEALYMGADDDDNRSYIQAVGNSATHDLVLNPRGGDVGIGEDNPEATLDVKGDVKMFGEWDSWTVSYGAGYAATGSNSWNYTASTDLIVVVYITADGTMHGKAYLDSPAGTRRCSAHVNTLSDTRISTASMTCPVKKGDSYRLILYDDCWSCEDPIQARISVLPLGHD
ncbi:hypothetical protein JXI42_06705 [bacterium]|nr:hypothetical protein [bacterium]